MKALATALLIALPGFANAAENTCQIVAIAMCACKAPYAVKCADGKSGFASQDQELTAVTLNAFVGGETKAVTLAPTGNLGTYNQRLTTNTSIIEQLKAQGIELGDNDNLKLRSFTGEIVLYTDADGEKVKE